MPLAGRRDCRALMAVPLSTVWISRDVFAGVRMNVQTTIEQAVPERLARVRQAMAANHAAQQSLNRARRSLDEDLFAA